MLTYVQKAIPQWLEEVSQGETVFEEVDELECDAGSGSGLGEAMWLHMRLLCQHNGTTDRSRLGGKSAELGGDKQDNHVITQNLQGGMLIAKG